jgi:tRNA pseudouridine38-40 synthase
MRNFKVVVSYNGVNFNGYQKQNKLRSVQGEIEKVLSKVHHYDVKSFGAGRTDKGVHALGQVFNFESELNMDSKAYMRAFNSLLPNDIYVKSVEEVDMSFHARYSSKSKEYHYLINCGEYNVLEKDYVLQFNKNLNIDKIIEASKLFLGKHDFKNFCASEEEKVKDYIREINSIDIKIEGDKLIFIFKGNGFLRYMVRMLVAILLEIGKGRKDLSFIKDRLDSDKLNRSNYKVDACGLYLVKVNY